jgi:hypothetical protein
VPSTPKSGARAPNSPWKAFAEATQRPVTYIIDGVDKEREYFVTSMTPRSNQTAESARASQ